MSSAPTLPGTIVAAVDGSKESVDAALYAIKLAKLSGAGVVALNVILLPQYVSEDIQRKLREELAARGQDAMGEIVKAAEGAGIALERVVVDTTTSVVNTVCDYASTHDAGMIVVGTRGTGGVAKLMLGSVAAGIARSARCPVLVVR